MRVRVAARRCGGAGELVARGVQQREVVEAGVAAGAAGAGVLDEHEQVLAAGAERGATVLAAVHPQADRALVEVDGAVEVGDGQLDGADPQRGGEDGGGLGLGGHGDRIAPARPVVQWQDVTDAWTSRARRRGRPAGARRDGA